LGFGNPMLWEKPPGSLRCRWGQWPEGVAPPPGGRGGGGGAPGKIDVAPILLLFVVLILCRGPRWRHPTPSEDGWGWRPNSRFINTEGYLLSKAGGLQHSIKKNSETKVVAGPMIDTKLWIRFMRYPKQWRRGIRTTAVVSARNRGGGAGRGGGTEIARRRYRRGTGASRRHMRSKKMWPRLRKRKISPKHWRCEVGKKNISGIPRIPSGGNPVGDHIPLHARNVGPSARTRNGGTLVPDPFTTRAQTHTRMGRNPRRSALCNEKRGVAATGPHFATVHQTDPPTPPLLTPPRPPSLTPR